MIVLSSRRPFKKIQVLQLSTSAGSWWDVRAAQFLSCWSFRSRAGGR